MAKRSYPLSKVYCLLEPGPVVLLTTLHKGRANVMTMSWHTMMEFEPTLVGCIVSGRDFSFDALKATRQYLGPAYRQIQNLRSDAGTGLGRRATGRRVLRQPGMPRGRYAAAEPLQLLCAGGTEGVGRPGLQ